MSNTVLSLDTITSSYSRFEKDQVLTHDQLNSIHDYLDDQERLTRVRLLGVGIISGLRASWGEDSKTLTVSKGIGITTDGDLIRVDEDRVFNSYKAFPRENSNYAGLESFDSMLEVLTDKPDGGGDSEPKDLSELDKKDLSAVVFMDSRMKDHDLCTGTDCDNLGSEVENTLRILLVKPKPKGSSATALPVPVPVQIVRPLCTPGVVTSIAIGTQFWAANSELKRRLDTALPALGEYCKVVFGESFAVGASISPLSLGSLPSPSVGTLPSLVYWYGFLKDLAETNNDFVDLLNEDSTACCPPFGWFPKHLVLGRVAAPTDGNPDASRTGFYPSPLTSQTTASMERMQFLARKIGTLIKSFEIPPQTRPITVTPSFTDERCLEERAIPCYYKGLTRASWSFRNARKGTGAAEHKYEATATAPATAPSIGRFTLFRIEGHLGGKVTEASAALTGLVANNNLPFLVRSVLAGGSTEKLVRTSGVRYGDLHRVHRLLREDLKWRINEAQASAVSLNAAILGEKARQKLGGQCDAIRTVVSQRYTLFNQKVGATSNEIRKDYWTGDRPAWRGAAGDMIQNAALLASSVGDVAKPDFAPPLDQLLCPWSFLWLDWLDQMLDEREAAADRSLLLSGLASTHPGLEYAGGVTRGGTFILVYDETGTVVADFMLPYRWEEERDLVPEEKPLQTLPWKPVMEAGGSTYRVTGTLDDLVQAKLDQWKVLEVDPPIQKVREELMRDWQNTLNLSVASKVVEAVGGLQKNYQETLNTTAALQSRYLETFANLGRVGAASSPNAKVDMGMGGPSFADRSLELVAMDARATRTQLLAVRERLSVAGLDQTTKEVLTKKEADLEQGLTNSAIALSQYVANSKAVPTVGSDAHLAMLEVAQASTLITTKVQQGQFKERLSQVGQNASDPGFRAVASAIALQP